MDGSGGYIHGHMIPEILVLGDVDDTRTNMHKAERVAALIYAHFKKEFK